MKTTEIIFGASTFWSMNESKMLSKNTIIEFDTVFSVCDLSSVDNYEMIPPEEIFNKNINYSFKNEINILNNSLEKGHKIRVWTSHYEVNSYLLFLFICNYLVNKECNIYVVYSDEYNSEFYSPSVLKSNELESLSKLEHKLSRDEIRKYSEEWLEIKDINSEMRVLENRKIKSVSFDYYNDIIVNNIGKYEEIRELEIVVLLMQDYYLSDNISVFLIGKLIEKGQIEVVKYDKKRCLNNIIKLRN